MSTPFLALAPFQPRVVDIYYAAVTLPCAGDCTDCDTTDNTDNTDNSDNSDLTDGDLIA